MLKSFITDRLYIQPIRFSDINDIIEMDSDLENTKYAALDFQYQRFESKSDLRKRIKSMVREKKDNEYRWVISYKPDHKFIGVIALEDIPKISPMCVSFRIIKDEWNKGIASEALAAIIKFSFGKLSLSSITATVHMDNIASQKVMEKSGFKKTGFVYGGIKSLSTNDPTQKNLTLSRIAEENEKGSATYFIYKLFYPGH